MKKITVIAAVFLCAAAVFSQEESFDYKRYNGFTLGGGANVGDSLTSGFIEAGFSWFSIKNFSLRNYVKIQGGGYSAGGVFGVREQLQAASTFAVTKDFGIRAYGFVDYGFFVFNSRSKSALFSAPYFMEVRGGGGVELLVQNAGIFVEGGGGGRFTTTGMILDQTEKLLMPGFGFVSVGGRYYF